MTAHLDRRTVLRLLAGAAGGTARRLLGRLSGRGRRRLARPESGAELRRWALGYAILAPNSHNRQPWHVGPERAGRDRPAGSTATGCCPRPIPGIARSSSARAPSSKP